MFIPRPSFTPKPCQLLHFRFSHAAPKTNQSPRLPPVPSRHADARHQSPQAPPLEPYLDLYKSQPYGLPLHEGLILMQCASPHGVIPSPPLPPPSIRAHETILAAALMPLSVRAALVHCVEKERVDARTAWRRKG